MHQNNYIENSTMMSNALQKILIH